MKSKKAKEFIKSINARGLTNATIKQRSDIIKNKSIQAVELAEEEMLEKAIETHKYFCPLYEQSTGICFDNKKEKCNQKCSYMEVFIKLLNN